MTPPTAASTGITDAQWDQQVRARLAMSVPELVPGSPAVRAIRLWAEDVWFVDLVGGGRLVAKHQFYGVGTQGDPYDLLQVEFNTLRYLRARGGAVPVAFGIDPGAQLILLEFVGYRTLANVLAARVDAATRQRLGHRVLRELAHIEAQLADAQFDGPARVIPGASIEDLTSRWSAVAAIAQEGLRCLWHRHCQDVPPTTLTEAVGSLWRRLGARRPSLGVTDYQPANIVVDEQHRRITFLELSKLGWDWTERRAVQYTTSVDGTGISVLDRAVVGRAPIDAGALDGHHLLFQLLLARRILTNGDGDTTCITRALVTPLSSDPVAREIRRGLQPLNSS